MSPADPQAHPSPPWHFHAGPLALFAALALVFLAPVLPDPSHLALGHPNNDVWNHVWGFWWVGQRLAQGELPLHTDLLAWPAGGSLWFIDAFNAVLTLPVTWTAGPVAAYNLAMGLGFWICGAGAYVLALQVARSRPGAVLAGVAYMSCPHLLGQAYNGISETLSAGWLPLSLTALLAARADPRMAARAGAVFGLTLVANWYYGLFAALAAGTVLAGDLLEGLRKRDLLARLRSAARPLLVTGAAASLVAGVPFTLFYLSMGADDAVVTRDPAFVWMTLIMHNMTDVVSLVRPGHTYSPDLKALFDEDLLVIVYLGHALLWPALAVLATGWRRFARPWALLALAFGLLCLGPFLFVDGAYVQVNGGWIPLPFLPLFKAFPLFSRISHAYRFAVGASLGLSILLAWSVRAIAERGFSPWLAAGWLGALRLIEALWLSPAVFPLPVARVEIPAIYNQISGGAVLDLPVSLPVLSRARYGMYQMRHGGPIPYGLNDPSPMHLYLNRYTRMLIELERSTVALLPTTLPVLDLVVGAAALEERGLRWIVVHRGEYPSAQVPKVLQLLDMTATAVADDGDLRVYRLGAAEGAAP